MHVMAVCRREPNVVGWTGTVEIVDESSVPTRANRVVEKVTIWARLPVAGDPSTRRQAAVPG